MSVQSVKRKKNVKEPPVMNKLLSIERKIEKGAVSIYMAIENGVVSGYKAVENGVVKGYKKIEDKFVGAFLQEKETEAN